MRASIVSIFALLAIALGAPAAPADAVLEKAEDALRGGFPKAAITPLTAALRQASAPDKHRLGLLLARVRLASGQPEEALHVLDTVCDRQSQETQLLRATAFAAQGSYEEAAKIASAQAGESPEAALLLARIRWEQGDTAAARAALPPPEAPLPGDPNAVRLLLDLQLTAGAPEQTEALLGKIRGKSLLPEPELAVALGRLRLAQSRPSDAAEIFRTTLENNDLAAPVRNNARLGLARSLIELGVDARAREVLRSGIAEAPDSFNIREGMEQWLALERKAGGDPSTDLRTWAAEKGTRRAMESRLQLARLDLDLKRPDTAITSLTEILESPELTPQDAVRARMLLAEARIAAGKSDTALELLDSIPPGEAGPASTYKLADLRGRALAAQNARLRAYEAFMGAFQGAHTPEERDAAAVNALLSALAAEDLPKARESYGLLSRNSPSRPDLLRWSFLLATAEARGGDIDSLGALTRQAPAAEYAFQAKLALAEWRLARGEAAAAERILRTAREQAGTEPRAAALAAAEIFAGDNSGTRTREELVAACTDFLANHADAPEAPDVAFKLGELYTLSGDHAAAESVLASLAQTLPDPDDAALAKFLAAQSAARSMSAEGAARALAWFDAIAQGSSPLRHRARFEQASLLLRDRRFADALTLYDRILSADLPPEVRHAALMEKGDTLFAMAADQPEKFADAAAVYAGIAGDSSAPADWRDQAACKHASALARSGQTEAALAAYREVLARPPGTAADSFWFYKAGIEAGRLLEEQQDWRAAIAVYDQIASAEGPQREELAQRARRLRLEHFIWEN